MLKAQQPSNTLQLQFLSLLSKVGVCTFQVKSISTLHPCPAIMCQSLPSITARACFIKFYGGTTKSKLPGGSTSLVVGHLVSISLSLSLSPSPPG